MSFNPHEYIHKNYSKEEYHLLKFIADNDSKDQLFKIYIDGNIEYQGKVPIQEVFPEFGIHLTEGEHRVVLRDFDQHAKDRKESNTLFIDTKLGEDSVIKLTIKSETIKIEET